MDLKENTKLIRFYLSLLKIHRQEFIDNYQPSHWELLTSREQEAIIEQNLLDWQTEQLKAQITINNFFQQHQDQKKILWLEKSKILFHTRYKITEIELIKTLPTEQHQQYSN